MPRRVTPWSRARRSVVVTALVAGAVLASLALLAGATSLSTESFQNSAVTDPSGWAASGSGGAVAGWPGAPCLTAGTNTAQAPVKGCNLGVVDAAGAGALRLTGATNSESGIVFSTQALPMSSGLDISFHQAQYGSTAAFGGACIATYTGDGIAFFLVDGSSASTTPGGFGGGLGYANTKPGTCSPGTNPGVANGLLAVGLDAYGNGSHPYVGGTDCAAGTGPGSDGPGRTPNDLVIRGPGNGNSGYCWLGDSGDLFTGHGIRLGNTVAGTGTRASTDVLVHVVIDPPAAAAPKVTVSLNGTQVLQIAEPAALLAAPTFKYGFAASTGGANDVHEVWGVSIAPVAPLPPINVVATPGTSSIDVAWNPPTNFGSSPVVSYLASTTQGQGCAVAAPATSCTITGVAPGSYTITVTATNASGTSGPSVPATATVVPPVAPPGMVAPPRYPNVVAFLPVTTGGLQETIADHRGVQVTVNVPPGALPVGTTVGIYACDPPAVRRLVPVGEVLIDCYAVVWTAPDGSHPDATAPVVFTVQDSAARSVHHLFEATGNRLNRTGGTVGDGRWSVGFTHDPLFALTAPLGTVPPGVLPGLVAPGATQVRGTTALNSGPFFASRSHTHARRRAAGPVGYSPRAHPRATVNLMIQLFALLALVLGGPAAAASAWSRRPPGGSGGNGGGGRGGDPSPGPDRAMAAAGAFAATQSARGDRGGDGAETDELSPSGGGAGMAAVGAFAATQAGRAGGGGAGADGDGAPTADGETGLAAAGALGALEAGRRRKRKPQEQRGSAALGTVSAAFAIGTVGEERGDRSRTWRIPGTTHVDRLSRTLPERLSRFSPVLGSAYADGDYARAIVGSGSMLLVVAGIVAGLAALGDVHSQALPPSVGLMALLIVIGVFDSLAGLAATAVFALGVLLGGGIESADSVRTLLGLGVIWFAIPLIARSARPLRSFWPTTAETRWDRGADFVIASLTGAWATSKMVKALPGLSGLKLPIVDDASTLAYVVLAALVARLVFETVTEHWYPKRLTLVAAEPPPPPSKLQQTLSVLGQTALLAFVAYAFLGNMWELYVGAALFCIPQLLKVHKERLPNSPTLYRFLPTNVVKVLIMLIVGTLWALVVFGAIDGARDLIAYSFVLLAIPGAVLVLLAVFGREGTRWTKDWPIRFAGVIVVVATILLATGTVKIT